MPGLRRLFEAIWKVLLRSPNGRTYYGCFLQPADGGGGYGLSVLHSKTNFHLAVLPVKTADSLARQRVADLSEAEKQATLLL
ncbi:hypothetical protein FACS1894159_08900 [Bacteroidia bacterium]|nr:hypothetical protein FACS1894159_08900 [Bacteroidia bacterium]